MNFSVTAANLLHLVQNVMVKSSNTQSYDLHRIRKKYDITEKIGSTNPSSPVSKVAHRLWGSAFAINPVRSVVKLTLEE